MTVRLTQSLDNLSDTELQEVAEYVMFLRLRSRGLFAPEMQTSNLESLYAEFAQEDHFLAEAGMAEYHVNLQAEDEQ
jgi:hypothetical protein